jgi:hypothetical protein
MVSQGQTGALVAQHQAELAKAHETASRLAARSAVATELSKYSLRPGATEQLGVLLGDKVVASVNGDQLHAHTRDTHQPVNAYIAEQLGRPDFAHFLQGQPSTPAQAGQPGTPPAANPAPSPFDPGSENAWFLKTMQARQAGGNGMQDSPWNEDGTKRKLAAFGLGRLK